MLNCVIVDDEQLAIDVIAGYIPEIPFLSLTATFRNPVDALLYIEKNKTDIVFIDIQMPQLNGLQFITLLQNKAQVIIISAYNEYAVQGFEHNVTDYLLKPVSFERFYKSAEKAQKLHQVDQKETTLAHDFIFVKSKSKLVKVMLSDILYIEGLKNYVSIYTKDNNRLITLQNMRSLEEILPASQFFRIQKSYIVSLDKIDSIERQRIFIGNKVIPIGETYASQFFSLIGKV